MNPLSIRPRRWLVKWRQWRADAKVSRLAMERFSKLHPHWHGAFFDQHFIERVPRATLERQEGAELAREWARQFRYTDERQRMIDIRQVTPIAESFLRLLEAARQESTTGEAQAGWVKARRSEAAAGRLRTGRRPPQGPLGQEFRVRAADKADACRRHE